MTTTVLITGASRGIGFNAATGLARRGCRVIAAARRPEGLAELLRTRVRDEASSSDVSLDADVEAVELDVTDDRSVAAAVGLVEARFGALDVLINNAGIPGSPAAADDIVPADFVGVFETDLLGPVRVTQAFLPLLRRGRQPRVVMVSSGMGSLTMQQSDEAYRTIAHLPYPAVKAALNMLTVQYAKALPEICFTAVDPGLTATEFTHGSGHSVEQGSEPVITAALDVTGPSGRFLSATGPAPW